MCPECGADFGGNEYSEGDEFTCGVCGSNLIFVDGQLVSLAAEPDEG